MLQTNNIQENQSIVVFIITTNLNKWNENTHKMLQNNKSKLEKQNVVKCEYFWERMLKKVVWKHFCVDVSCKDVYVLINIMKTTTYYLYDLTRNSWNEYTILNGEDIFKMRTALARLQDILKLFFCFTQTVF